MLVVQMVRVLAQTARGVDLSPTKCYPFPCSVWVVCEKILFYNTMKQLRIFSTMMM